MRRLFFLAFLFGCTSSGPQAPDLILVNGKVFTAEEAKPWAEAVAIRGDRIVAVGTTTEIRAIADTGTRVIDMRGRTMVPGINAAATANHSKASILNCCIKRRRSSAAESARELAQATAGALADLQVELSVEPTQRLEDLLVSQAADVTIGPPRPIRGGRKIPLPARETAAQEFPGRSGASWSCESGRHRRRQSPARRPTPRPPSHNIAARHLRT